MASKIQELKEAARVCLGYYIYYASGRDVVVGEDGNLTDAEGRPCQDETLLLYRARFDSWLGEIVAHLESYYDTHPGFFIEKATSSLGGQLGFAGQQEWGTVNSALIRAREEEALTEIAALVAYGHWQGQGAQAFQNEFLDKFVKANDWQQAYVQELTLTFHAFHEAIKGMQEDVKKITDACIVRLSQGQGEFSFDAIYSAYKTIAGIAALIAAPEIVGAAEFAYGIWKKSQQSTGPPQEWTISDGLVNEGVEIAASPVIIFESTWDALMRLRQLTADNDADIEEALKEDLSSPYAFDSPDLTLDRPAIANSYEAAGPDGLGESGFQSGENLVASLVHLYRAGRHFMPELSGHYQSAAAILGDCELPGWVWVYLPHAALKYGGARADLERIFTSIESSLEDAAENLIAIAEDYELTDADNEAKLAQIESYENGLDVAERLGEL